MPDQDNQASTPPPFFTDPTKDPEPEENQIETESEFTPTPENIEEHLKPELEQADTHEAPIPTQESEVESPSTTSEPTPKPEPEREELPSPRVPDFPKPAENITPSTPATLPESNGKRASGITLLLLAVIAIISVAGATFLFLQNLILRQQVNTLQSTLAGREVTEITPTPTIEEATTSATPSPSPSATYSAFADLSRVLGIARQQSATAQLLMITSDDITKSEASLYKYWFRTSQDQKQYFYIQYSRAGDPQLYTQATISPDNNIPDLVPFFEDGTLGLTDLDSHNLAWKEIAPKVNNLNPEMVKAKFIRSRPSDPSITQVTNLWQLTYIFPQGSNQKNVVIQVDAFAGKIVFSNL